MSVTRREVRAITLTFDDGSTTTVDPVVAYYTERMNYNKGAKKPEEAFREHSIHWTDR